MAEDGGGGEDRDGGVGQIGRVGWRAELTDGRHEGHQGQEDRDLHEGNEDEEDSRHEGRRGEEDVDLQEDGYSMKVAKAQAAKKDEDEDTFFNFKYGRGL